MVKQLNKNIVIVGGGIAAISAIKAIREIDSEIKISMFLDERFYPYNRLRLTKSLFGKLEEDNILLQKKDWYEVNKVELNLHKKVVDIDVEKQHIALEDGETIEYHKLLLACGASNFKPPIEGIDKENVFTIRYLQQAWDLKESVKHNNNPLIIGGGIQGLETAWELNQQGEKVAIAEIQPRLMPNQLDERASTILQHIIESLGIKIYLNSMVQKIVGEGKVSGIVTNEGNEIPCDMVIYNAGIRPNIELMKNTSITANKGVVVDNKMETNIKGVFAAGDVAEYKVRVFGLWNIAVEQGKTAGYNIMDRNIDYKEVAPVTTLNAFGISLFSMGNTKEDESDKTLIEDNFDNKTYKRIFIRDKKIIGAIVIGDTKKSPILKTAIEGEVSLEHIDLLNISVEELLARLKK